METARARDAGRIATALGLLSSCVKSGEDWSEHCEKAKNEAFDALTRLSSTAGQEWRVPEAERASTIEQCAKVAEAYDMDGAFKDDMLPRGWRGCRRQIAAAIRALLPAPPVAEPIVADKETP